MGVTNVLQKLERGKNAQRWWEDYRRRLRLRYLQSKHGSSTALSNSPKSSAKRFPISSAKSTLYKATAPPEPSSTSFSLQVMVELETGRGGPSSYKEKFTVVDDERRVKETEVVEGGFLDLGFTLYRVRFEVIEKEGNKEECVTRSTVEYELKEEAAANAALVSIEPLVAVMKVAADYLTKNYNNN
ncbi:uncharacterized protein LOC105166837 isoform X1 [Sesamum indicum]|uniref:Uncharacterized protein LOC105166837 isoform X1 n=1 Tax=Sesamum indicum TaxID=4182 RepID=A0A8M8V451_SESIN|nr:uncharacterized protein LOC105166837 isoform X1 [Sesamum indicum]